MLSRVYPSSGYQLRASPVGIPQRVALHAAAAMGVHPFGRDGDRPARRHAGCTRPRCGRWWAATTPSGAAQTVLDVETRLAQGPLGARGDPRRDQDLQPDLASMSCAPRAERRLGRLAGGPRRLEEVLAETVVRQPSLPPPSLRRARGDPVEQWREWLAARVIRRAAPTYPPPSSRRTSTSTAAPSTARPSCAPAGSAAWPWSRAPSARPSARSTSPGTSRRAPRRSWTSWSRT